LQVENGRTAKYNQLEITFSNGFFNKKKGRERK
jgi:hypothetical protein